MHLSNFHTCKRQPNSIFPVIKYNFLFPCSLQATRSKAGKFSTVNWLSLEAVEVTMYSHVYLGIDCEAVTGLSTRVTCLWQYSPSLEHKGLEINAAENSILYTSVNSERTSLFFWLHSKFLNCFPKNSLFSPPPNFFSLNFSYLIREDSRRQGNTKQERVTFSQRFQRTTACCMEGSRHGLSVDRNRCSILEPCAAQQIDKGSPTLTNQNENSSWFNVSQPEHRACIDDRTSQTLSCFRLRRLIRRKDQCVRRKKTCYFENPFILCWG